MLIFHAGNEYPTSYLVKYDLKAKTTQEVYKALSDSKTGQIGLYPRAVSPDGENFIVATSQNPDGVLQTQYCVHGRNGERKFCLDKPLSRFADLLDSAPIAWTKDGRTIRHLAESDNQLQIVESDAETGKIVSTIFTYTVDFNQTGGEIPYIGWTDDARYIVVSYDANVNLRSRLSSELTDRFSNTNQQISLTSIGESQRRQILCPSFSSKNHFLARFIAEGTGAETRIKRLELIEPTSLKSLIVVDLADIDGTPTCPIWNSDESTLYFYTKQPESGFEKGSRIYVYSLPSQQLKLLSKLEKYNILDALVLSPDETQIAFTVNIVSNNSNIPERIYVMNEQGIISPIAVPYQWASNPLWLP